MVTATIAGLTQAAVRALLAQKLGLEAAGLFQASYAISTLNISLVLSALTAEYYPRLSAAADDREQVTALLNDQLHVGLILAGPVLLAISATAPSLLQLLYTAEFTEAAPLLRLQIAADVLRIQGWALGYVLLVRRRAFGFVLAELCFTAVFLPLTWLAAPRFGVAAAGAAYFVGYSVTLMVLIVSARQAGVWLKARILLTCAVYVTCLLAISAVSIAGERYDMAIGLISFVLVATWSYRELERIGMSFPTLVRSLAGKN